MSVAPPSAEEAAAFLESSDFVWHQRFELVPGVHTPGVNDIEWLLWRIDLPGDLTGMTVLDIGTTNGGTAFALERRGASVVAVDMVPPDLYGFERIRSFLGSSVRFVQASVYELPEILETTFDVVVFWGVLYHLRHPLLALDRVRRLCRGRLFVETAVADHEGGELRSLPAARFYRFGELGSDPTNWFAPTVAGLQDWVASAGFDVTAVDAWPEGSPTRSMVSATVVAGIPEYQRISYERPIRVHLEPEGAGDDSRPATAAAELIIERPPPTPSLLNPMSDYTGLPGTPDGPPLDDEEFPLPPDELRWRVTGHRDSDLVFRQIGRVSLDDQQIVLRLTGRTMESFESVLDFGCGCGRVMRHMAKISTHLSLHGCDIDGDAIAWASKNLPFATFRQNAPLPPLPYEDGQFDLVVNHSVFTHLPEDYQDAWLAELRRVVRPGGYLLLSVAGPFAFSGLVQTWLDHPADPSAMQREMDERGFVYVVNDAWQGSCFPDFYHSAFHSPAYVVNHWSRYLTVLAYAPQAALSFIDLVLLRRD